MKKLLFIVTLMMAAFTIWSCGSSLSERFNSFVTKVENEYSTYSEDDWTAVNDKYDQLVAEYNETKQSLSPDEKKEISNCIGRYTAVLAKASLKNLKGTLQDAASGIPELMDEAKSFLKGLGIGEGTEE